MLQFKNTILNYILHLKTAISNIILPGQLEFPLPVLLSLQDNG